MKKNTQVTHTAANLGYEAKLWAAADALSNNMDAAEYKHVVLGLILLKYLSDAFEGDRRKDLKDGPPPAGNGVSDAISVHHRQAA